MTVHEIKQLLKTIKEAIIDANNRADYKRVQYLRVKKYQLRAKIWKTKNESSG